MRGVALTRHTRTPRRSRATRRSKRLSLRIPVHVRGRTPDGHPFEEDTVVTDISKHGAKILSHTPIAAEEELELQNHFRDLRGARFRVVWVGRTRQDGSRELGLSYAGVPLPSVFGIFFP